MCLDGMMKCCSVPFVSGIDICTMVQDHPHYLGESALDCVQKSRFTIPVASVRVCAIPQQYPDYIDPPTLQSEVQSNTVVPIPSLDSHVHVSCSLCVVEALE
jgi:hypothetical protein